MAFFWREPSISFKKVVARCARLHWIDAIVRRGQPMETGTLGTSGDVKPYACAMPLRGPHPAQGPRAGSPGADLYHRKRVRPADFGTKDRGPSGPAFQQTSLQQRFDCRSSRPIRDPGRANADAIVGEPIRIGEATWRRHRPRSGPTQK